MPDPRKRLVFVLLPLAAVATAAAEAPAAPQAYVDTRYVVAPHAAGGFTLERSSYDPDKRLAGASFLYRLKEQPDVVVNVYMYAAGRMAPDDALAGRAARALVPAMQVVNVGGCANATINLDVNATPAQSAAELSRQVMAHKGYSCHLSADAAGIAEHTVGADVIPIHYQASDWTSQ